MKEQKWTIFREPHQTAYFGSSKTKTKHARLFQNMSGDWSFEVDGSKMMSQRMERKEAYKYLKRYLK